MAAGALCEKGYLTVKEDNTVELQTQWKTLAVFGLSGDASQIKVYQTNGTTGDTQDAVVDSTRKVQGTDGEVEVPEKVHFSMPVLQAQGAYINMFVGAMNMNVDAFIQVDYETAEAWVAPSVEITQKEVTVEEGKTTSLAAVTVGTDASYKVTWASDNCDVATVDENTGLVTGVKKGTAHITTAMDQVSDTALATVTETKKEDAGNTGSGSDTGNTGSGSKAVWKSSNSKVVKVNQKGYVTAGKAGSAKITVKVGKVEATCKVTVKKASLWVSKNKVVLKKGKKITIKAKAVPGNKITFTSSKKKVATVSSKGVIKGKEKP